MSLTSEIVCKGREEGLVKQDLQPLYRYLPRGFFRQLDREITVAICTCASTESAQTAQAVDLIIDTCAEF